MKTFERYVAGLMLTLFSGLSLGLVALFIVIDFGDWLHLYIGKPVADVATLYGYRGQLAFAQLAPAAMVLAAALTITVVRRRGEWTALRALGASAFTLVRPVLLVCAACAAGLVAFEEFATSDAAPKLDKLLVERFNRQGDMGLMYAPRRWFRAGDALVNVRGEFQPPVLNDVRVFRLGLSHELVEWTDARQLTFLAPGRWRADDARSVRFVGAQVREGRRGTFELDLALEPEAAQLAVGRPEWMPLTRLVRQVELLNTLKLPSEAVRFSLQQRVALPVAALLAAFIACVLGLRAALQPSTPRALLEGAALYGSIFVLGMMARSLAMNSHLPPDAAAWLTPALLLVAAVGVARRYVSPSARR